ncbi:DUF4179 domain-containing protein [Pelotomaculum terephthalicicum JT]|uniref:DUF4179 domain-containing protein n=1 Tax=Pelotomaculum TaxID=191373 RepID=UPI0009CC4EDA|nr:MULTISPECIES: DUF4179 domain-containing protein [Pelotomaculum]MCG9968935.1 DUF4179 domain-containing protein [Pelotomaculum terephthalicicum JT]OPX86850.1 MAG: hypothetical protein A4E54_01934 [Pelotomaculum sp. PtaB.Bin117]OPY59923.1 MAG: hypothetical protein A4E56_03010 [Pelotomaculum sp. PtaU1.Bin065]
MDELIKQGIQQDAGHCQVHSIPWDQIRERAFDDTSANTTFQRNAVIHKICYSFAAVVVIGALVIMSGFISPAIARALEQIPVINAVFNFVEDRGIQNAIDKGFVTQPNLTATDKDISVTITDVLYDQGRIDIGYTVTTSRPNLNPETFPGDLILPLGAPGMQFFANGKPIQNTTQATCEKMDNGRVGLVEIYPSDDLPETFNLEVAIHQIGKEQGEWLLGPIPVSRKDTDAATRTFSPMKKETFGETSVMVKEVKISPLSTLIEYESIRPLTEEFYFSAVMDDKENNIPQCASIRLSHQIKGDTKITIARLVCEAPKNIPEFLVLVPHTAGSQQQNIKIPLK